MERKGAAGVPPPALAVQVVCEMFCSFHALECSAVKTIPKSFVMGSVRSKSKPGFTRGSIVSKGNACSFSVMPSLLADTNAR